MFDMWESGSSGKARMTSQCVLRAQGPGPWGKIDIKVPVRAASGSRRE